MSFHGATPKDGQKLVIVDVTFTNHKDGFGLAGVLLIDGDQDGPPLGEPHKVYLEEDGRLMADQSGSHLVGPFDWDDLDRTQHDHKPIRVYLVYTAPKTIKRIGLGYWGRIIVDRPYEIEGIMPSTPPPYPGAG